MSTSLSPDTSNASFDNRAASTANDQARIATPISPLGPDSAQAIENEADPVSFRGLPGKFIGHLAGGSILTCLTLGLYRFWLITNIRRHLYNNTIIFGDCLEYSGRGGELFRGFLIGMLIVTMINFFLIIISITQFSGAIVVYWVAIISLSLLFYFAEFRGFAYRVSRSRYRGIAGSLDARVRHYLPLRLRWDLLTGATLGLAIPFRRAALDRYLIGNCRLGDQKVQFTGTGWSLAGRVYLAWMIIALIWIAIGLISRPAWSSLIVALEYDFKEWGSFIEAGLPLVAITGSCLINLYLVYLAIWHRWRLNHLSFGTTRFLSALRARQIVGCYLRFGAGVLLLLVLVALLLTTASFTLEQHYPEEARALFGSSKEPSAFSGILTIIGILVVLMLIGAMRRYFIERGVWVAVMSTLTVTQPQALIDRLRYCEPTSAGAGEGLADAFALGP